MNRSTVSIASMLRVAVWFGLLSGIAEALIYAVRRFGVGEFMVMNWHFPWMVPLFTVVLFVCLGIGASPLGMVRRLPFVPAAVVAGLGFIASYGPLAAIPGLARPALVILSLGIAAQIGRWSRWEISTLDRWARRMTPALAGFVIVVAGGMLTSAWAAERYALAQLPAPPSSAPNVILVVLDTVRAKSLSTYGYPRATAPTLQRVASEGAVFERALAPAPWTLPSQATMFTGRQPHEHGADWSKPLDSRYPTLAEALRARGYATAGFAANTLNVTRFHGLARGFIHFEDLPVSAGRLALSTSIGRLIVGQGSLRHWLNYHEVADRQPAERITTNFLTWMRANRERPFFAFLNYFDAHDPYLPPDPFATKFGPRRSPTARFWHTGVASWPVDRQKLPPQQKQAEVDAYDGAIAYTDSQLDRLLRDLAEQQLLDNTLLIVTSDHGEQLGEHGLYNHGNSMYRPLMHVPLVMRFPGRVAAGVRVPQPVSLRNIPRTVLDLLAATDDTRFPGFSLARFWRSENAAPADPAVVMEATRRPFGNEKWYPLLKGDIQSVVAEGYQYLKNGDGTEELYDFENDVDETVNLVTSPAHSATLARLRRLLEDGGSAGASPH
jgi:arylsulfatase A-like enzyme